MEYDARLSLRIQLDALYAPNIMGDDRRIQ